MTVKSQWSSSTLSGSFDCTLVGFDFRVRPAANHPPRSEVQYLGSWYDEKKIRLTVDEIVWPRVFDISESKQTNEYGLADRCEEFDQAILESQFGVLPQGALAAFDMPTAWIDFDQNRKFSKNLAIHSEYFREQYRFCGFDIVDAWGFVGGSALYSFDWELREMEEIMCKSSFHLNKVGLITNRRDAILAAVRFDELIPEHSPFVPSGIWISEL